VTRAARTGESCASGRGHMLCVMNKLVTRLAAATALAGFATASLLAGDGPTSARPTAEAGFAALRKAAADHDDATLAKDLPSALVKGWTDESRDDASAWRAAFAGRIADGEVVRVGESGDNGIARWKTATPPAVWEMRLHLEGAQWIAASPWAYCVGGGDLAKANGKGAAHVKLKARQDADAYGPSAFSFAHVTPNPKQCLNRMDVWYCRCGKLHASGGAMISARTTASLGDLDGLQTGGDWMDEVVPKKDAVYVVHVRAPDRADFQVALQLTALTDAALEFDWRLVATGKNAPASIHAPQPLVSNAGADGTDGLCGKPAK
jgi:hypothetical protein